MEAPPDWATPPSPPPFVPDFDAAATDAVTSSATAPLRVTKVDVRGLRRTALATVAAQLTPLTAARTVGDVAAAAHDCVATLLALGPFAGVDVELDAGAKEGTAVARVTVDERPPLSGRLGSYVSGTEGSVEGEVTATSVLGRGETVSLTMEKGAHALTDCALHVRRRAPAGLPCTVDASLHRRSRSWASTASFDEGATGAVAGAASLDGAHAVAAEAVWRTLADATGHASAAVKAAAGHSLKTALRYTWRTGGVWGDGPGEAGAAARTVVEVAAPLLGGGDAAARHVRASVDAAWHVPLAPGVGLAVVASAGVLAPWGASPARRSLPAASIPDRFFLGGFGGAPCAPLRGFTPRAAGPADARHVRASSGGDATSPAGGLWDFVGGDVGASVAAFLRCGLPFDWARQAGLYGHAFVGAGALAGAAGAGGPPSPAHAGAAPSPRRPGTLAPPPLRPPLTALSAAALDAAASWRASAGVGLVWPTAVGNLEVDWVTVLRAAPHDRARSGFHVGFAPRL